MGGTPITQDTYEMCTEFWSENPKEICHLAHLDVDRSMLSESQINKM